MQRSILAMALAAAGLWGAAQTAAAGTVTVITSFPKELTTAYQKAFEAANPGIKVEILNKNTTASVAYIRELPEGQRPDVMWASAPDAFEVLASYKLLQGAPEVVNRSAPEKIGNYPLNDPKGMYYGQALAGYGIEWNTRYLKAHKLPVPKEWSDLVRPEYFGHIAISSPSRSGTTQLTVETILQGEGWDKGWTQLLQIMGNAAAVTDRSFAVPDGVNNGQYGIGIVIDFLALAGKYSGYPVDFTYPSMTAVVPANIALIAGAKNADEAKKFMAYTMSVPGQQLLFDPKIGRLPILPYSMLKPPAGYPVPQDIAKRAKVQFNTELSGQRYPVVISLFDQMVTFRLKELQAATKAIHEAAAALKARPNARGGELLAQARSLAYTSLVGADNVKNPEFLELFRKSRRDVAVSKQLTGMEQMWSEKARANYERARQLAEEARGLAK
ncbi:extracellular solute-binding protein [Alicycliphilus denitrificans]|uniref:Extracellular solute-binding protein family 1 n=2 Tax=Alicycliphilus denitrificans TaxID=179636 RepID=F4GAQ4_ALIDK|nr:extracellular solute-binding protein [Alicycliphilus denitrificans]ADU99248.1 extracellular solute-binding protein family 1 [Alicycliphilus denitrificans BC]AEB85767.1 extracellular solute-binding protein family 1 [Alicycliphilus denitrificans K601]QKD43520.1 extracellular solute-binding protein [Alicycliphilus denitrificans]GAO27377.1 family 1 extracellular solute-binding protein [Alicycliphilus sp. B1]